MMAAPPLPPRQGGMKMLWPQYVPPAAADGMQQSNEFRAATPPPLPPRRWVSSTPEEINELLRVPPPPSLTTFKKPHENDDNNLINFNGHSFHNNTIHQLILDSSKQRPPSHLPISLSSSNCTPVSTPTTPSTWLTSAFNNTLYFPPESFGKPTELQQGYVRRNSVESFRSTELQQSWSAPDLARLPRPESTSTHVTTNLRVMENILVSMKKKNNSNLIDFSTNEEHGFATPTNTMYKKLYNTSNDILQLFDPLAEESDVGPPQRDISPVQETVVDRTTESSELDQQEEVKKSDINGIPSSQVTLDDGPLQILRKTTTCREEVQLFAQKLKQLRSEFKHDDYHTNLGLVVSPTLESYREDPLSIKLVIDTTGGATSFTCDVNTSVEHVICHVVCDRHPTATSMEGFVLKVHGLAEYLAADSALADYEYVHQCHKFDLPVHLTLMEADKLGRPLARNDRDDLRDTNFHPDELTEGEIDVDVTFRSVTILLETLHAVTQRLREQLSRSQEIQEILQPQGVVQAVKAICTHLGCLETNEVTAAVQKVNMAILLLCKGRAGVQNAEEDGELLRKVDRGLSELLACVHHLLRLYSQTYQVDFSLPDSPSLSGEVKEVTSLLDTLLCKVEELHRVPSAWSATYERFSVTCQLRHGIRTLAIVPCQKTVPINKNFFDRVVFDGWLEFESIPICTLPRESHVCFLVYGTPSSSQEPEPQPTLLGWSSLGLFDHRRRLQQGEYLLGLWPDTLSPSDGSALSNLAPGCPLLRVGLPQMGVEVRFPEVSPSSIEINLPGRPFESLEAKVQDMLNRIVDGDPLGLLAEEEKELLWERRQYLQARPHALPKLLQAAHGWDWACLPELYSLLKQWTPLPPADALVLLLPDFPDFEIRRTAIAWLKGIGSDELCDYLPQLVQVLRFESWLDSPVVWFLLERSLTSVRVAHHLYWLLRQADDPLVVSRCKVVVSALLRISGQAFRQRIERQASLVRSLGDTADRLKTSKEATRLNHLFQDMERVHHELRDAPTSLPLSPALEVNGVLVKSCAYFTSNTLPLKVVFESGGVAAIFKAGDDLRQDMLTLQMIRIMDKLWLKEGLDLKIVTFGCVATGPRRGMVEMVEGAETLRKIQTELGLTGSFKERPIAEWLARHNPSELEYQQAVENFTLSCAGYCVATHVLGIGDRHNDNIMLKTSGHIFHIDFGKFLGDSQKFGNIKRDRAPFVLTSDMAYVINGGDKPTKRFQVFVELCCQAFNILRKRSAVFLNLFALMLSSGIPGVTSDTVGYVERALLPYLTEVEATAHFARMIEESLRSWFTQFNFFIHNLAQLRFTGDHNDGTLLSFTPRTFTKEGDGRIRHLTVVASLKRYDPEKKYLYQVRVDRENCREPSYVARSYREFCELQQKLSVTFPNHKFHVLPRGALVGRSNVREVAERRIAEISAFLESFSKTAEEIGHCPLVYTFFHPLLRDQEQPPEATVPPSSPEPTGSGVGSAYKVQGHVKLSIIFKNNSFFLMVMHAKNLRSRSGGKQPDPYVKAYLLPDPGKLTKRKTKTVFRNANPTFMEMLVYQLPLEVIQRRTLHVSVWDYDRVQENQFLGAAIVHLDELDLRKETTRWYELAYLPFRTGSKVFPVP